MISSSHKERRLLPTTWASESLDVDTFTVHDLGSQPLNTLPTLPTQYAQPVEDRYVNAFPTVGDMRTSTWQILQG